ncbi:MAG: energy transducer TonB [Janthinobacterium lividum]
MADALDIVSGAPQLLLILAAPVLGKKYLPQVSPGAIVAPYKSSESEMNYLLVLVVLLGLPSAAFSQAEKKIQKAWIRTSAENLSDRDIGPDTLYTRYTFDKPKLYISFYPGWDDYQQEWTINQDKLAIGFDAYHIEELTDTSLVIKLAGFRKYSFLTEDYLSSQKKYLDSIGVYKGKVLYKANNFITPRYLKGKPLGTIIQKSVEGYNVKRANYFLATFVITESGEVENIKILKGITSGFDNEIIKQLQSTSKYWKPARYRKNAVQTEMRYEIKYLNSIVR